MVKRVVRICVVLIVALSGLALSVQSGHAASQRVDPPAWVRNLTPSSITAIKINESVDNADCFTWNQNGGYVVSHHTFTVCQRINVAPGTETGFFDDMDGFKPGPDYFPGVYYVRHGNQSWRQLSQFTYTRLRALETATCRPSSTGYMECTIL